VPVIPVIPGSIKKRMEIHAGPGIKARPYSKIN
jgi:hypothetical protein